MEQTLEFRKGLACEAAKYIFESYANDIQDVLAGNQNSTNILARNDRAVLDMEMKYQQQRREFDTIFSQALLATLYGSLQYFHGQRIIDANQATGKLRTELIAFQSQWLIDAIQTLKIISDHDDQYSAQCIWNILKDNSKMFALNQSDAQKTKSGILGTVVVWNVLEILGYDCCTSTVEDDMRKGIDLRAEKKYHKDLNLQIKTHSGENGIGLPVFNLINPSYIATLKDSPDEQSARNLFIDCVGNGSLPIMAHVSSINSNYVDQTTGRLENLVNKFYQKNAPTLFVL